MTETKKPVSGRCLPTAMCLPVSQASAELAPRAAADILQHFPAERVLVRRRKMRPLDPAGNIVIEPGDQGYADG
jgi:hypothetical protein